MTDTAMPPTSDTIADIEAAQTIEAVARREAAQALSAFSTAITFSDEAGAGLRVNALLEVLGAVGAANGVHPQAMISALLRGVQAERERATGSRSTALAAVPARSEW